MLLEFIYKNHVLNHVIIFYYYILYIIDMNELIWYMVKWFGRYFKTSTTIFLDLLETQFQLIRSN